jgi:uncharacterized membrane protein YczE
MAGLLAFAAAISLMIRSGLGLGPWDAFHVGLHRLTGMSVGTASILAGFVIVCASPLVGIRPAVGTLVNMVAIGGFIDLVLPWVPPARHWEWGLGYYLLALALAGVGTGMYIAPGLGAGPRDGLMVGLAERSGWSLRRVRTLLELSVLVAGWAMGGPVGVGTILFTLGIGPTVQWGMERFGVAPARRPVACDEPLGAG